MSEKSASFTDLVLDALALISSAFAGFGNEFERPHVVYKTWLVDQLRSILSDRAMAGAMRNRKVDWLTLHYATRHPVSESEPSAEWFRISYPVEPESLLAQHSDSLEVNQRSVPPYLRFKGQEMRGNPAVILLSSNDSVSQRPAPNHLVIPSSIISELQRVTRGPEPEKSIEQDCVQACLRQTPIVVEEIAMRLAVWSGEAEAFSAAGALNLLRNICRVTLIALRKGIIELPRLVVLAPVHAGENLIGGIAFIGPPPENEFDPTKTRLLQLVAHSLLSGVRLREEAGVTSAPDWLRNSIGRGALLCRCWRMGSRRLSSRSSPTSEAL